MNNPIKYFQKRDWIIWIVSLSAVALSNILSNDVDPLTLSAALIGVTALVFAAKGNVWAQLFMIVFSILYGIISWRFRYWGEMLTYLGMSLPMAVWSSITWVRHSSAENGSAVQIRKLTRTHVTVLFFASIAVTVGFYFILRAFHTPNIVFSTISVTTSFLAASLTMLRSSYYGLCYASNDIVLIVLWILASAEDPAYIPVVVNFIIFFLNDMYGFMSWKQREALQN